MSGSLFRNVFNADLRVAEKVCIVAPGPNGRECYSEIPHGYQVVAVSKAVLIPELHPDIWVMNQFARDWCNVADVGFKGVRLFSTSAARAALKTAISPRGLLAGRFMPYLRNCYQYKVELSEEKRLGEHSMRPVERGMIRGFGSVSGCALQLAYLCGARRLLLCGVDMSGNHYWDGSATKPPKDEEHGPEWWFVPRLNNLIRWLNGPGAARVETLSLTRLDVPRFSP